MSILPSVRNAVLCCFFTSSPCNAQQAPVALDRILAQLDGNIQKYVATVPNLNCAEHLSSQELRNGKVKHQTNVEAMFRVRRPTGGTGELEESREILSVDGRPPSGKQPSMPITLTGAFGGMLIKFLSVGHQQCFSYREESSSAGSLSLSFIAKEEALEFPSCHSIQRGTTGKFSVDLIATQVTHLERTVPFPIGKDQSVLGSVGVDFAPVMLGGMTFWLPATVTASTTETAKTDGTRFTAHYNGYHLFGASSKIVPAIP